ncbi:hypothetical protein KU06062659_1740004 [Flavobacterium psychrophilum]|nr:hypothetical protein KU06062659_1740004 [Flavobacterium psychrophilum]SNB22547.1 hypothetical protein JIP1600_590002 [Flavobacterium psychrophilum]
MPILGISSTISSAPSPVYILVKAKIADTINTKYAVFFTVLFLINMPEIKIPNPKIIPIIGKWFTTICKCALFMFFYFSYSKYIH